MSLKHMPSAAGYSILARNLRRGGYSAQQIADIMTKRLALERFDGVELDEVDRRKLEELREFLISLTGRE